MALLEIACFSADNAIAAWNAGADRIELCDNGEAGGITPSLESLVTVKKHVNIPVFVMIRPRGGDFNYSDLEYARMKDDIDVFKSKADGCVFGILDKQDYVDIRRTTELVQKASPLPCTFHRAFDETRNQKQALEDVVTSGCHAILSSGGASTAVSGATVLRELVQLARGRVTVIPGGGIRVKSLLELYGFTRANVYHSSGLINGRTEPDPSEIRQMKMLLREKPFGNSASIALAMKQNQSLELDQEDGDDDHSHMHLSAVSIGANTPVDEHNRHLS